MKQKNVLTVGCFDCLHEGHINLFKEMRKRGRVVVGVHNDESIFENKGRFPVQDMVQRQKNLCKLVAMRIIDAVFSVSSKDPTQAIQNQIIMRGGDVEDFIYMRGNDWRDFPGRRFLDDEGVKIIFVPYTEGVSTTQIRKEYGV